MHFELNGQLLLVLEQTRSAMKNSPMKKSVVSSYREIERKEKEHLLVSSAMNHGE